MEPGEFDLVGFAVGVVERARVLPGDVQRRRRRSSASPARACAATATRSPARRCSTAPVAASTIPRGRARTTRSADELLRPSVIYAPAMRKLARAGRRARVRARHRRRPPRQPRPGAARRTATPCCAAARGRSRGSSARSRPRATSPTTRWSTCSTSASGCWPSSRRRTASIRWMPCGRPATKRGWSERCQKAADG